MTPRRANRLLVVVPVVLMLLPLGYSLVTPIFAREGTGAAFLERPDPVHESCVEDTTYMRLHHWELLTHVRDEVMRDGQRGIIGVIGLNRCRECHTSRERFCNRCHNEVDLNIDCFGCHYYPETAPVTSN